MLSDSEDLTLRVSTGRGDDVLQFVPRFLDAGPPCTPTCFDFKRGCSGHEDDAPPTETPNKGSDPAHPTTEKGE
jgi:hypothetical protein